MGSIEFQLLANGWRIITDCIYIYMYYMIIIIYDCNYICILYICIYIHIYVYIYIYIHTYVALDTYLDLLKMIFNRVPNGKSNTWEIYRALC